MKMKHPAAAWQRRKSGSGPLHDLTETIAKTIHEERYGEGRWEKSCEDDQWLAVGSWMTAETVVAVLPLAVTA